MTAPVVNDESYSWSVAKARQRRGMTLLEVLVSLLTIMIFVSILLDRFLYYQESAEKAAMEATAREVESALRIRAAELMLSQRYDELARLDRIDPFTLFQALPGNYAGSGTGGEVEGVWRYDVRAGEIAYRPRSRRHLEAAGERLRWRVHLLRDTAQGRVAGVRLELLTPYRWFD